MTGKSHRCEFKILITPCVLYMHKMFSAPSHSHSPLLLLSINTRQQQISTNCFAPFVSSSLIIEVTYMREVAERLVRCTLMSLHWNMEFMMILLQNFRKKIHFLKSFLFIFEILLNFYSFWSIFKGFLIDCFLIKFLIN